MFTSYDCCKKITTNVVAGKKKHKFILLQFLEVTSLKQVSLGQNQAVYFLEAPGESLLPWLSGTACTSWLMAPSFLFSVSHHITPTCTSVLTSPNLTLTHSFSSFTPRTLGIECIASTQITQDQEFPGGPVVKTLHSHCQGPGFNPWSGNWDSTSQVTWPKKKKNPGSPPHFMILIYIYKVPSAILGNMHRFQGVGHGHLGSGGGVSFCLSHQF